MYGLLVACFLMFVQLAAVEQQHQTQQRLLQEFAREEQQLDALLRATPVIPRTEPRNKRASPRNSSSKSTPQVTSPSAQSAFPNSPMFAASSPALLSLVNGSTPATPSYSSPFARSGGPLDDLTLRVDYSYLDSYAYQPPGTAWSAATSSTTTSPRKKASPRVKTSPAPRRSQSFHRM